MIVNLGWETEACSKKKMVVKLHGTPHGSLGR